MPKGIPTTINAAKVTELCMNWVTEALGRCRTY